MKLNAKNLISTGNIRHTLFVLLSLVFVFITFVFIYQYLQFSHFEKGISKAYNKGLSANNIDRLLIQINEAENQFRLYTVDYDKKVYSRYVKSLDSIQLVLDSFSRMPIEENPILSFSATLHDKKQIEADFITVKRGLDDLITYSALQDEIAFAVYPRKFPEIESDSVITRVLADSTYSFSKLNPGKHRKFIEKLKALFSSERDSIEQTIQGHRFSDEQVMILQNTLHQAVDQANHSHKDIVRQIRGQFLLAKNKEKELLLTNYNLISKCKEGLNKLKNHEFRYRLNAESQSFNSINAEADRFWVLLVITLVAMGLLLLLTLFYIMRADDFEARLKVEKAYASAIAEEKTAFLASISHEIRTPLNSVLGLIDIIRNNKQAGKIDETLVESAHYSLNVMANTVNDILDLGQLESEQVEYIRIRFSPYVLFNEVLDSFQHMVDTKGLKLVRRIEIDPGEYLVGNALKVKQLVLNLVSNAIKYTDQGMVSFEAGISRDKSGALLRFSVADTGIGISEEDQKHLFRKYFRSEAGIFRGGTGLGLYICHLLVERLSGKLDFESEFGKGTIFRVQLPFAEAVAGEAKPVEPAEASSLPDVDVLKGLSFLIVDDYPMNINYMKHILNSWGAEIQVLSDGTSAVEDLLRNHYDFLLTDIRMPGMNGVELLEWLRRRPEFDPLCILAITADISLISAMSANEQVQFDGIVLKPYTEEMLKKAILGAWIAKKKAGARPGKQQG